MVDERIVMKIDHESNFIEDCLKLIVLVQVFLQKIQSQNQLFSKIEEMQTVPIPKSALNFNLPQKMKEMCNEHDSTCVRKVNYCTLIRTLNHFDSTLLH